MKHTILVLVTFFVALATAATLPHFRLQQEPIYDASTDLIKTCGTDKDLLTIETIELHPDPPRRGEKLTVYFKGYLSKTVAKGTTVDIVVKFNVIQLIKKRFDFCDEIQKVDEECPIEPGVLEFTKEIDLPKEIPPGKYTVHAVITSQNGEQVTCLDGHTIFRRV